MRRDQHISIPELGSVRFSVQECQVIEDLCKEKQIKKTTYIRKAVRKAIEEDVKAQSGDSDDISSNRPGDPSCLGGVLRVKEGTITVQGRLNEDDNGAAALNA